MNQDMNKDWAKKRQDVVTIILVRLFLALEVGGAVCQFFTPHALIAISSAATYKEKYGWALGMDGFSGIYGGGSGKAREGCNSVMPEQQKESGYKLMPYSSLVNS